MCVFLLHILLLNQHFSLHLLSFSLLLLQLLLTVLHLMQCHLLWLHNNGCEERQSIIAVIYRKQFQNESEKNKTITVLHRYYDSLTAVIHWKVLQPPIWHLLPDSYCTAAQQGERKEERHSHLVWLKQIAMQYVCLKIYTTVQKNKSPHSK